MDPPELPIRHKTPSLTFLNSLALLSQMLDVTVIVDTHSVDPEEETIDDA